MREWEEDTARLRGDAEDLGKRLSASLESAGLARNRAELAELKLAKSWWLRQDAADLAMVVKRVEEAEAKLAAVTVALEKTR